MMPMSFGSLIPYSLKTKRPCLISVKQRFPAHILQHTVQQALRCANWKLYNFAPNVHLEPELCASKFTNTYR